MSDFDPYYKWLGVPPKEQPPHYYRLLGLSPFESDLAVIENAADQRQAHIRNFANGKHSALSQQMLNELSAARVCLMDAEKKAAYDAELKAKLRKKSASKSSTTTARPAAAKPAAKKPSRQKATGPNSAAAPLQLKTDQPTVATRTRKKQKHNPWVGVVASVSGVGILAVVLMVINSSGPSSVESPESNDEGVAARDKGKDKKGSKVSHSEREFEFRPKIGDSPERTPADQSPKKKDKLPREDPGEQDPGPDPDIKKDVPTTQADETAPKESPRESTDDAFVYLDDLKPASFEVGYGELGLHGNTGFPRFNDGGDPEPQRVQFGNREIEHAIALHPPSGGRSFIAFELEEGFTAFAALAAIQDSRFETGEAGSPLTFRVLGDGKTLWESKPLQQFGLYEECRVQIAGVRELRLEVHCPEKAGHAWAVWIDPRLVPVSAAVPAGRLDVPDEVAQRKARLDSKKTYPNLARQNTSAPEKIVLARSLISAARQGDVDATKRFVLLDLARAQAADAGDLNLAMSAIGEITRRYKLEPWPLKVEVLSNVARRRLEQDELEALLQRVLPYLHQAIGEDQYDAAQAVGEVAASLARRSRETPLIQRVADQVSDVRVIAQEYRKLESDIAAVAESRGDPLANARVGSFFCFYKHDWTLGLELLAQGNDAALKRMAEQERKATTPAAQVQAADVWFQWAKRQSGREKTAALQHAIDLYRDTLPSLSGKEKERVEELLLQAATATAGRNPRLKLAPGIVAECYRGENFELKLGARVETKVSLEFAKSSDSGVPREHFSVRFAGYLVPPVAGRYTIILQSDDGSRLWLEDTPLIDLWETGQFETHRREVTLQLEPRPYALRVDYFEKTGMNRISLRWRLGGKEQEIPPECLFHQPSGNQSR